MAGTLHAHQFPAARVAAERKGRRVSVVIPARNEAETIGEVVEVIRRELMERHRVVDELVVVDDGSSDATAHRAAAAGAEVVRAADVLPEHGPRHGKGQAMWRGLHVTTGDVVAFCDGDIIGFGPQFVLGTVGPLLADDRPALAKACYARPLHGRDGEGGRVTELAARPLIALLHPELAGIAQPLAGEYAGRREVLEAVPVVAGYGVDLALLIDIAARHGAGAIVQCDLGRREHRNRPLAQLSVQAMEIWQVGLQRAGLRSGDLPATLVRPGHDPADVVHEECPPLAEVAARRMSA